MVPKGSIRAAAGGPPPPIVAVYDIGDKTIIVACLNAEPYRQCIAERRVDRHLTQDMIKPPIFGGSVDAKDADLGLRGRVKNGAAGCVSAPESALRTSQNFDALHVEQRADLAIRTD